MPNFSQLSHFRSICRGIYTSMSRRSQPPTPDSSPRVAKRPRLEYAPLTSEDYKNGLMLAPMVRSGACEYYVTSLEFSVLCAGIVPTRLYALKHGAKLVWGPETIDKAILHTTREVDRRFRSFVCTGRNSLITSRSCHGCGLLPREIEGNIHDASYREAFSHLPDWLGGPRARGASCENGPAGCLRLRPQLRLSEALLYTRRHGCRATHKPRPPLLDSYCSPGSHASRNHHLGENTSAPFPRRHAQAGGAHREHGHFGAHGALSDAEHANEGEGGHYTVTGDR